MGEIATVVSVMGDDAYHEMASISLPSFLKNNVSADLFIFTDDVGKMSKLRSFGLDRVHVIDMLERFRENKDMIEDLTRKGLSEEEMRKHAEFYGHFYRQIFISSLIPIAEDYLKDKKYSHILKIDVDSYFAGGDMMLMVEEEIKKTPEADLYLIQRTNEWMCRYGKKTPGTGFTLWRKGSHFASSYVEQFAGGFQVSVLRQRENKLVCFIILDRPGYHFVYPFEKARQTNREFTREIASGFLPAYFHLFGKTILDKMKKLEEWFGDKTDKTA